MRRNGITMLVVAVLLLAAYGGRAPAAASPTRPTATTEAPVTGPGRGHGPVSDVDDDDELLIALDKMAEAFQQSDPQYANVTIQFTAVPFEQLFPTIETAVAAGAEMDLFLADGPDIKHYAYNEAIVSLAGVLHRGRAGGVGAAVGRRGLVQRHLLRPADHAELLAHVLQQGHDRRRRARAAAGRPGLDDGRGLGRLAEDHRRRHRRRRARCLGSALGPGHLVRATTSTASCAAQPARRAARPIRGWARTASPSRATWTRRRRSKSFEDYRDWHQGDRAVTPREPIHRYLLTRRGRRSTSAPDNAIGTINRLYPDGDFNYGVTGIPYYADGAQVCHTGSWHVGVSPQTKNTGARRWRIAKFFAGPEGFQDLVRRQCASCRRASTCSTRCRSTTSTRSSSSTRACRPSASRASRRLATPSTSRSSPS